MADSVMYAQIWLHQQELYRRALWATAVLLLILGLFDLKTKLISQAALPGPAHKIVVSAQTTSASVESSKAQLVSAGVTQLPPDEVAVTDIRGLGRAMNAAKFGDSQWPALNNLWSRESNWRPEAVNRRSGACGIPQALPCGKIPDMSPVGQIEWGLNYIAHRYGTPGNAWEFWQKHRWY